jgi:hypothetical protein
MRVKDWSTPRVTIHRHLEICHLGMQFVHNWLRKRTYALCKSCRGMLDLQLSYSNFCALQFKFLEKNPGQSRQAELVLTLGAPERRPRRRSRVGRAPAHWARTPRSVSDRQSARRGTPLRRTAFLPHSPGATRAVVTPCRPCAAHPLATSPYHPTLPLYPCPCCYLAYTLASANRLASDGRL